MRDTGFWVPASEIDRLVTAYRPQDGKLVVSDEPAGGKWSQPPLFEQGDAGLVSTIDDYFAFVGLLLGEGKFRGRQLLTPASIRAMTTNHLTPLHRQGGAAILGPSAGWGYGLSVTVDDANCGWPPGSIGWAGGVGTIWHSDPAQRLSTILFTQREFESATPAPIYDDFERNARSAVAA